MNNLLNITQRLYWLPFLLIISITQSYSQQIWNKNALTDLKIFNEKLINTSNLESSPAFIGDKIAFVYTDVKGKLFDKEIDEPYFQLGFCDVLTDNSLDGRKPYNNRINSDLHEGPMSYDANQNKMFLTRSHIETRKIKGVSKDTAYLRILSADLNVAKPDVKPININVENYSVCHPTLSKDGKTMIFSSNKPGGYGQMDLYITYFNGQEWSGIVNVGHQINTTKNEVFPYMLNDTILIYASDRDGGMGGFDLYVSKLADGTWQKPELLPSPFNTGFDDLGLIIRENMKSGYFSSNRPGGKGKDDIYRFESSQPIFGSDLGSMVTSSILVLDKLTLEAIPNAEVTLTPLDIDINNFTLSSYNVDMLTGRDPSELLLKLTPKKGQTFPSFFTDVKGNSKFQIKKSQKYLLNIKAKDFNPITLIYDYLAFGSDFNIVLEPEDTSDVDSELVDNEDENQDDDNTLTPLDSLLIHSNVGDVIVFENIYFDYNSTQLQLGATQELDALVRTMKVKADITVRLESHTDSRGTAAYNLQLSINRANAIRDYLQSSGIDEDRIKIRGYGESKLRNKCADNVPCTDAQHRFNRRTEVVIESN
jgi:outer membrane protein OmpA-like peptidoglycan-associated protein